MDSPRRLVLKLLVRVEKDNSYSNILLDKELAKAAFDERDKRFVSALFYGVLERKITLDAVIDNYSKIKLGKLDKEIVQILRMGIYQLLYMDSVPDSAAVNESVKLAKRLKNPSLSGFVNGVLRSFVRDDKKIPLKGNRLQNLSAEYSCPLWLLEKLNREYGENIMLSMAKSSLGKPPLTVRVNSLKTTADEAMAALADEGFEVSKREVPCCLEIKSASMPLEDSCAYKQGLLHVQDLSSQLCAMALNAKEGETVIDVCSAPGGKAFTLAQLMNNKGRIIACDLHENRVKLINDGASRLGINIINAVINDGTIFNSDFPMADKILCDVPCSGLGVIRRKPEIKYKNPQDFSLLPELQYKILATSSRYLKKGGTLIYSTCTLSRAENDEVVKRFLSEHPYFASEIISGEIDRLKDCKATIVPDYFNSDGFFICKMKRVD